MCGATRGLMSGRRDDPAVPLPQPEDHVVTAVFLLEPELRRRNAEGFTRGLLLGKRDQFGEGDKAPWQGAAGW
jgi:hypothetical protein